jgi:hypothetical protein
VLRFLDRSPDVVYGESAGVGRLLRNPRLVADRIGYWDVVHRAALSQEDTREFLTAMLTDPSAPTAATTHPPQT